MQNIVQSSLMDLWPQGDTSSFIPRIGSYQYYIGHSSSSPYLHSILWHTVKIVKREHLKKNSHLGVATYTEPQHLNCWPKKGVIRTDSWTPLLEHELVLGLTQVGCLVFRTKKFRRYQEWSLTVTPFIPEVTHQHKYSLSTLFTGSTPESNRSKIQG